MSRQTLTGMTRGVPGLGGGSLPTEISDDFASDSGKWLDGALTPAAIVASDGRGIWTPVEEAELHTSSNAAADPNGTEANATTGWNASNVTLSVESSDVNTGNYALKAVAASTGVNRRITLARTNASRKWRVVRIAAKAISGAAWKMFSQGVSFSSDLPLTADWDEYVYAVRKSTDYTDDSLWLDSATISDTALLDNVSVKELVATSQYRLQRIYYPSTVEVGVNMTLRTPVGVVVFKDSDNWVLAFTRRVGAFFSVALWKCVAGAVTVISVGVTTTYSAGAVLKLAPAADFQTWTVTYDNVVRVNAAAITDFAPTGTWYAGLFTTHNPNDTTIIGFDDFLAERIGESPPFEFAPAVIGATATLNATAVIRESSVEPDWFGRPVTEVLSNGTVVMIYYRSTAHTGQGFGALHISFSDDYGDTWTAEDTDLSGDPVTGFPMNPPDAAANEDAAEPYLIQLDDGTLIVTMWRVNFSVPSYQGTYQSRSTDGGLTWTTPERVTISGVPNDTNCFIHCDHFILGGVVYATVETKSPAEKMSLISSDDDCVTWTLVSDILTATTEAGIEYVGDDTIVCVMRTENQKHTYLKRSVTLGATWGATNEYTWQIPAIGQPRLKTRAHIKGEADWWNDAYMILWGFTFGVENIRTNMVSLSKDRGISWTAPFDFDAPYGDAGYGDVFYNVTTGEYVFVTYRGTSAGPAQLVQYNFSVDWGTP